MSDDDLAALQTDLADLTERVAALEAAARPTVRPAATVTTDLDLVRSLVDGLPSDGEDGPIDGSLVYAGAGPGPAGTTAIQMAHSWNHLLAADPAPLAACLAALGSPVRLRIIRTLLAGSATTAQLAEALDAPSAGQLFHHLKELLAVGLIHQPSRGTYAVRPAQVVSIITALACAHDLASPTDP